MSSSFLDYLSTRNWDSTSHRHGSDSYMGHCPFHADTTPSFLVKEGKYARCLADCQGDGSWWSLPGLIAQYEGIALHDAYEKAKAYGYHAPHVRAAHPASPPESVFRPPTPEQIEALRAAMQWWHACLWAAHRSSEQAFLYLRNARGVGYETIREPQLGYAPPREESWVHGEMPSFFSHRLGKDWLTPLTRMTGIGLFTSHGYLRVQNRIMFTCLDKSGQPVFYTGRAMPESNQREKYLNVPGLQKVPFRLPLVGMPSLRGTVVVESPFGVAAAQQHRIPTVATLGPDSLVWRNYEGIDAAPFWCSQDNDAAGERQAIGFAAFVEAHHQPAFRVIPSKEQKGFDEWLHRQGTAPFFAQVRENQGYGQESGGGEEKEERRVAVPVAI